MLDKKKLFETKNANLTKNAKHFLFQKAFFCKAFIEKIQGFGFPNKNGIFEKIQGFPKENLCPFLFYGKGYQVRKLVSIPFHPFSQKRGREGIPGMDTTKFGAKYNLSYFLSVRKKEI